MEAVTKGGNSRYCCFFLVLCIMIVTCLLVYSIDLASLNSVKFLKPFTAYHSCSNTTVPNSPIEELLHNISTKARVIGVDCTAIFKGSESEIVSGKTMVTKAGTLLSDAFYLNLTEDCVNFQKQRGYIMSSLTHEEEQFPLAFSLIVYQNSEMVERLLRAIYRPQNVYCVHVDQKASDEFFRAISAIANCFTNVFIASRRIKVVWATYTVLEPELLCMEELWRYRKWRYFINLTGQEFPLKTNYELVKILTAYRGAVDITSTIKHANRDRWRTSPPHGLLAVKGSVHITVNRDYVDFILHNETAKDLLRWVKTTHVPDETYFAMLNSNPKLGIKGTYTGEPEYNPNRPFLTRYKHWGGSPCAGRRVRDICILTTGDLPRLGKARQLFANKFYLHEDRVVIGCLEEKIFNDTRDEYMGSKTFNTTYYENVDFVKNKVQ